MTENDVFQSSSYHSPTSSARSDRDNGTSWNNLLSRRRFLKRTGGATAATFLAWTMSSQRSAAEPAATGNSNLKTYPTLITWTLKIWAKPGATEPPPIPTAGSLNGVNPVGGTTLESFQDTKEWVVDEITCTSVTSPQATNENGRWYRIVVIETHITYKEP